MKALALLLENLATSGCRTFNGMFPTTSRYAIAVSRLIAAPFHFLSTLADCSSLAPTNPSFAVPKRSKRFESFEVIVK